MLQPYECSPHPPPQIIWWQYRKELPWQYFFFPHTWLYSYWREILVLNKSEPWNGSGLVVFGINFISCLCARSFSSGKDTNKVQPIKFHSNVWAQGFAWENSQISREASMLSQVQTYRLFKGIKVRSDLWHTARVVDHAGFIWVQKMFLLQVRLLTIYCQRQKDDCMIRKKNRQTTD